MHAATLRATDIVLAAGALVVTALEATLLSRYGATWVTLGNLGVHVAVTGALAVRHDLPRVSAAVTVIALGYLDVLAWQSPVNLGVSPLLLALPLAVHLTARREPFGWASMGLVAAIAVGYFSPMRLLPSRTDQNVWTLLFLVTILGAFVLGAARRHSDIVYEGKLSRERERLDAQTVARIDRARTGERERIAREVHDIVAHNLAVIQVQASTSIAVGSEEQLRESMLAIKRTSSEALTEIRTLVRLLRDQETGAVASDLSQVRTFVQAARAAGIRVDADLPDDDTLAEWQARWPNLVRATLLRVTQEAVTNVIKHGGPDAQAVVSVRQEDDPDRVVAEVDNDRYRDSDSPGFGLLGVRERVELLGGTLEYGPRGSGFHFACTIPIGGVAP